MVDAHAATPAFFLAHSLELDEIPAALPSHGNGREAVGGVGGLEKGWRAMRWLAPSVGKPGYYPKA